MTQAEYQAEIARLTTENQALKAKAPTPKAITFKVSEKGAVSVYGLGRFPITLYAGQWERLMPEISRLAEYIKANEATLSRK